MSRFWLLVVVVLLASAAVARADCECIDDDCGCCAHIDIPKIIDSDGCLNITVIPSTLVRCRPPGLPVFHS